MSIAWKSCLYKILDLAVDYPLVHIEYEAPPTLGGVPRLLTGNLRYLFAGLFQLIQVYKVDCAKKRYPGKDVQGPFNEFSWLPDFRAFLDILG